MFFLIRKACSWSWKGLCITLLFLMLESCAKTQIGQQLANSFDPLQSIEGEEKISKDSKVDDNSSKERLKNEKESGNNSFDPLQSIEGEEKISKESKVDNNSSKERLKNEKESGNNNFDSLQSIEGEEKISKESKVDNNSSEEILLIPSKDSSALDLEFDKGLEKRKANINSSDILATPSAPTSGIKDKTTYENSENKISLNKNLSKIPFIPSPYRITIKLSGANPAAPAETVTNALRNAGVSFQVEKIERVEANDQDLIKVLPVTSGASF